MGSNPTQSIEPSVQIPSNSKQRTFIHIPVKTVRKNRTEIDNKFVTKDEIGGNMRDLYKRQRLLQYWMDRINTDLHDSDKVDVLNFIQYMQDNERAILWIVRCITALLLIRKQLKKPFKNATRDDIRSFLLWMEEKGYKPSTNEKFRQILKFFYKTIYGNGENYPEAVKWFPTKLGKDKRGKNTSIDMSMYLEQEQVRKLIECAPTLQKKAFLSCMYESGSRPEEFLRLTNTDIRIETNGVVVVPRGKTGERTVMIIAFSSLLLQWLEVHPLRNEKNYSLWISESTNCKNAPLGIRGAEKIIENTLPKAGIQNKHAILYILRHSRATHLANHLTEAQMCVYFGWTIGSRIVQRYIHLSGKDVNGVLLSLNNSGTGKQVTEEYKLKPNKCIRCDENIAPANKFCGRCGLSISLCEQYIKETNLEEKNRSLELKIDSIEANMNEKFAQLMLLIQQNPKLALVKPNVLLEKIQ